MIKRYDCILMPDGFGDVATVEEYEGGDYVKYDDIKHLLEKSDNSDNVKCRDCNLIKPEYKAILKEQYNKSIKTKEAK